MVKYVASIEDALSEGDYTYSNGFVDFSQNIAISFAKAEDGETWQDHVYLVRMMARKFDGLSGDSIDKISEEVVDCFGTRSKVSQETVKQVLTAVFVDLKGRAPA